MTEYLRTESSSHIATVALWWILLMASVWVFVRALMRQPAQSSQNGRVGPWKTGRLVLFIAGAVALAVSQMIGAFIGGPVVRAVFGEPFDFLSDYTSPEALFQAVVTQLAAASFVFTCVGVLIGKSTRVIGNALWACNPMSMLGGVLLIVAATIQIPSAFEDVPYEYVGFIQWVFHIVATSGVYAWLFDSGRRIGAGRAA